MPTKHESWSYKFSELTEEAQEHAIEVTREKFAGDWWDQYDNDQIGEEMIYFFADAVGNPKSKEYGSGDFPGFDSFKITEWDLYHHNITGKGTLYRDEAPNLPWTDSIDSVSIGEPSYIKYVTCNPNYDHSDAEYISMEDELAMDQAIHDAFSVAMNAGQAAFDYMTSEERARDFLEDNDLDFTENGDIF